MNDIDSLRPIDDNQRVFNAFSHASLWFSLGVGLLVMQVGAYLVPAVGTRDALLAIMVPIWRGPAEVLPWLVAGAAALLVHGAGLGPPWPVLAGAFAGAAAGAARDRLAA